MNKRRNELRTGRFVNRSPSHARSGWSALSANSGDTSRDFTIGKLSMLHGIRRLLGDKRFWLTLLVANGLSILSGSWPFVVVPATGAFLLLLCVVLGLGNFIRSRAFPKVMKWTGVLFCWFFTGLIVAVCIGAGTFGGFFTTVIVNLFLWLLPTLAVRWVRHFRKHHEQRRYQMQRATFQKRRSDARARCELYYNLNAPEFNKRFTHGQFTDYWNRHFGDEHPPEYVEERATQLLGIMQKHLEKAGHPEQKKSLSDIALWFLEQKTRIDALPLNPEDKEQMIADLEGRFTQLQQRCIRSMNP